MNETDVWVAKAAIAELIARYAILNDAADWDAVAALYTEDGRMSRPVAPDQFIVGRDAILAGFRGRPRRASRHIVANILVDLEDENRARATSQILLFTGTHKESGALPMLSASAPLIGTFDDQLLKTAVGWRFAVRRGKLDFQPPT
jgi:ketosteroid isomerase-like protein